MCLLLLIACLSSCVGTRFLEDDQQVLFKQQVSGERHFTEGELDNLYQQQPNKRILLTRITPYVWLYRQGERFYRPQKTQAKIEKLEDVLAQKRTEYRQRPGKQERVVRKYTKKLEKLENTLKEGNLPMRWGEPVTLLDPQLTERTALQIELYMRSKGYFAATAHVKEPIKVRRKRAFVEYVVQEGKPWRIDSVDLRTADSAIAHLLAKHKAESLLALGATYDQDVLSKERNRIDLLLKENGYYAFSRQYILFRVDTTLGNHSVAVQTVINQPTQKGGHRVYSIDSVRFTTDASVPPPFPNAKRKNRQFKGVNYRFFEQQYTPKILNRRLFIHPGDTYKRSAVLNTQRQLANLDMFRFININYDTTGGQFIANIYTSPLKKFQLSQEVGVNVTQGFPGPFYNISLRNRNLFGGLEILELSGRIGIEGVAAITEIGQPYQSREASVNASLIYPEFVVPFGSSVNDRNGQLNPNTTFTLSSAYTNRPEYQRSSAKASLSYTWQNANQTRYNLSPLNFSLINSTLRDDFDSLLRVFQTGGNNLLNSFLPSVVSGASISAIYNFNRYGASDPTSSPQEHSAYLQLFAEVGGLALDSTFITERLGQNLTTYRFVKTQADFRQVLPLTKKIKVAYRVNGGIALPFGANQVLPYEKYFFTGGSNSIRAWRPRRLGPGSFAEPSDYPNGSPFDYQFEQPGEVLFEASVEYRQNLFSFIDGAFFVDMGNVWTIREDTRRPGAQFQPSTFAKQIAVGAGVGARLDFSFLILRIDVATKVYDPARAAGERFMLDKFTLNTPFGEQEQTLINIGIGYPF